ncbi:MAG TPA: HAMP domain-containing sensor histidine kinase [Candidatus Limnocylindrales bacterium]|nr:HAMP domain-containing sensor histidine kinase [Candidatus Limnocylindrales bacterium]
MRGPGAGDGGGPIPPEEATRARGVPAGPEPTTTRAARWWRPVVSVRARVLASVMVMALLGVLVAGGVVYLVQARTLTSSITSSLEQEVAEFRALAETGLDPETGAPFASIERLLRVALQRNVPDRNETYLTLLDGVPLAYNGGERPVALESEPAVLAAVSALPPGSDVVIRDVATSAGLVRVAIVPVQLGDADSVGSFVMAYSVDQELEDLQRLGRVYALVSLATLVLVGLVGWQVAGRLLRPLRTLRETTQRITETDLTERIPVRGNDDLSELTRTYNDMLDRLQDAIDTQRRFLDDAGHELRTPITIVRGHLELLDPADPEDVAETRALLLDEVDRMGRMVADLILLSKAQRPDFLEVHPIDLAGLTLDVAEKARMLGDRNWVVEACADGVIDGDPERLTQALVELAQNAMKFSDPGSTIGIGSALEEDQVRLWVRDEGCGIEAEDVDRIFERFSRGESGRAVDGSGLGLSIVSTIATAHGGHMTVDSRPGVGSTFTLVLPTDPDHADAEPVTPLSAPPQEERAAPASGHPAAAGRPAP